MKRISAVICELNPLHDGHRYVFSEAKRDSDILIAVMSGNFVQRGEPAVYHKYERANAALHAGADIVLELPFPYSSSSAEFFAYNGVRIAEGVGAAALYFGSECGDIEALKKAGKILKSEEYRNAMGVGRSAILRSDALRLLCPDLPESLYSSPNDILGAEYCRCAGIETVAVKRITTESASSIRRRSIGKEGCDMLDPQKLSQLIFNYLRTRRTPPSNVAEGLGGVAERLYNTAFLCKNALEWAEAVKTKQYTDARLRRAGLYALCDVSAEMLKTPCGYTRLLGANTVGREYLSAVRKNVVIPFISNHSEKKYLERDVLIQYELGEFADSIYALLLGDTDPAFFIKAHPWIID